MITEIIFNRHGVSIVKGAFGIEQAKYAVCMKGQSLGRYFSRDLAMAIATNFAHRVAYAAGHAELQGA